MKVQFKIMTETDFPVHLIEEMSLESFKNIIKHDPNSIIELIEYWENKMKREPTYERSGYNDPPAPIYV